MLFYHTLASSLNLLSRKSDIKNVNSVNDHTIGTYLVISLYLFFSKVYVNENAKDHFQISILLTQQYHPK